MTLTRCIFNGDRKSASFAKKIKKIKRDLIFRLVKMLARGVVCCCNLHLYNWSLGRNEMWSFRRVLNSPSTSFYDAAAAVKLLRFLVLLQQRSIQRNHFFMLRCWNVIFFLLKAKWRRPMHLCSLWEKQVCNNTWEDCLNAAGEYYYYYWGKCH